VGEGAARVGGERVAACRRHVPVPTFCASSEQGTAKDTYKADAQIDPCQKTEGAR